MQQLIISSFCVLLLLAFIEGVGGSQYACTESKCGDDHGLAIHFPFRRGHHYGDNKIEFNGRHETVLDHPIVLVKFLVNRIDYKNQEIEVYNAYDCLLLKPLEITNTVISPFYFTNYEVGNVTLFRCPTLRNIYDYQVPCLGGHGDRIYGVSSSFGLFRRFTDLQSCTRMYDILSVPYNIVLQFKWSQPNCTECEAEGKRCRLKINGTKSEIECVRHRKPSKTKTFVATGATLGSFVLLLGVLVAYHVYSADQKEKENRLKLETFLADYKALKPSRYSYADIKRITNQFKCKLGEGAYGTVFKGKLSSECFVAVKVLNNSKADGKEFVNEVGAMGHIHHVNVVRLVGFCADGFRRALVYEFFPNGSLQDYISSVDRKNSFLGWDKLQDIAIGIAKGMEYLHLGCDLRILHFDIKPHNILLDRNFTPKIFDFGLAKLCSKDQSIVSMTTARGTMGYIAPEVFSRNFGNVSYKVDVYSFGMLLLEMIGGKKNIGSTTEDTTNAIYYP